MVMARYAFVSTKAGTHRLSVQKIGHCQTHKKRGDSLKKSTDFHVRISDDELELIDEKSTSIKNDTQ